MLLETLFEKHGFCLVQPDMLQPADPFLNLMGEAFRRRLFITQDSQGTDLCLRPEFTIPVCINHKSGQGKYWYYGTVFRQRNERSVEFEQAGVEVLGGNDAACADAEIVRLALDAVELLGRDVHNLRPHIKIGDPAFFNALVHPLGLPAIWCERLMRSFGDEALIETIFSRINRQDQALTEHFPGEDVTAISAKVHAMMENQGLATNSTRTSREIAERFIKTRQNHQKIPEHAVSLCKLFLDIECPAAEVADTFNRFSDTYGLDFTSALAAFENRLKAGLNTLDAPLEFAASFGRRLDYYTGFVFEIFDANAPQQGPLAGGGRYDQLNEMLGGEPLPAVGFSLWPERFEHRSKTI